MHSAVETSTDHIPKELDSETGLYYYRARYYDQSTGRFLSEDPARFDGGIEFYAYVSSNPINSSDPFGLYETHPKVPLPLPPALDKFMKCMDDCTGGEPPLYVRATTNGEHQDPGHKNGTTLDLRPTGIPSDKVFCCAGRCGAPYALDERKIHTPKGDGKHYHIQLVPPLHPNPAYPNAIPDRPECKPGGCDANNGAKK
jgi:RHS repeat-associated protein